MGSTVLLGVTGGIAAYKSLELVRRLRADGHQVRCALSRAGAQFVTPLSLEVLSGHPLYGEDYLQPGVDGEERHIEAARWARVLCVAPATAHALARLAQGLADDFLSTTALAFEGPLVLAPAMHRAMWGHEAVRRNVERLRRRGARFVGPMDGPLASGESGPGRMAEPEAIAAAVAAAAAPPRLAGRTVVVSAGPTREPIDPVRFLSNRSSGRMGFALAAAAAARGARTVLVAGPVERATPWGVERVDVETAEEMRRELLAVAPGADLVVLCAAVSDFRPVAAAPRKIKRASGPPGLRLEPVPDLAAELGERAPRALRVGFAAETGDPRAEARRKLRDKGLDWIVANDVSRPGIGFASEDNEVTLLGAEGDPIHFERQPKTLLAGKLMDHFTEVLNARDRAVPAPGR